MSEFPPQSPRREGERAHTDSFGASGAIGVKHTHTYGIPQKFVLDIDGKA